MPSYLQLRRRRWYAILEIPAPLRRVLGKPRFVHSLETDSRIVADRRVLPVITAWKKEIAAARNEPVDDDAAYWRRALRNAKSEKERQSILEQIDYAAWNIGSINVENIGDKPSSAPEAQRFYGAATGQLVGFTEHLDEWLSTSRATAKTKDMHRADVVRFAVEFKMVQDVTRPEVRRWITRLMNDDGLMLNTVQRILSALRGYWRYLQSIGVASEDHEPFSKLDVARQNKRDDPRAARQPFESGSVVKLWKAAKAKDDRALADLIELSMWSGARIEELCALKVEKVRGGCLDIGDAKTEAGWRKVPIHAKLKRTVERLKRNSKDGYLLSGLTPNKYGDRSNAVGKRFGRLKSELGFAPQHVFHSIRKTVATLLENAGVPEGVSADILGHEKPTMTYGLYSGGASLETKRKALAKLSYPAA